ncbi:unnamed protein product [Caenorhabditis sp. 36 PRJEB53466]|nr:unnamed protein product [Caenorhabditis sp. 36 PRJEB53466]
MSSTSTSTSSSSSSSSSAATALIHVHFPMSAAEIRMCTQDLLQEITDFIEHKVELEVADVKLPVFYATAFNFLKSKANEIGHRDPVLEFLPHAVEMLLFTEVGPPPAGTLPVRSDQGLLVDPTATGNLVADSHNLIVDVLDYCENHYRINRALPKLPFGYQLTISGLQTKYCNDPESYRVVHEIPKEIQKCLNFSLEGVVPNNYVQDND